MEVSPVMVKMWWSWVETELDTDLETEPEP